MTYRFLSSIRIVTLPTAGRYIETLARSVMNMLTLRKDDLSHLISDVLLEVLVCSNVQANTASLQPLGLDFVVGTRDCRYHDIGDGEDVLQSHVAGIHDMSGVVARRVGGGLWALIVLLDRINIDREDACAVVGEQGSEGAADDFRPITRNKNRYLAVETPHLREEI